MRFDILQLLVYIRVHIKVRSLSLYFDVLQLLRYIRLFY